MLRVTALIDWDACRRLCPPARNQRVRDIERIFAKLQDEISSCLISGSGDAHYRVRWRVYHGWYAGKTKTEDRLSFERYVRSARSRNVRRVSFGADFSYSEILCCNSHRSPIFDTLRADESTSIPRQKMVDTALACDLLHLVRTRDSDVYVVVADDDDFVPALFTAESWKAKVVWLHKRPSLNSHLKLDGLACRMGGP